MEKYVQNLNKNENKTVGAGLVSARGITLISLVITIVILIILASVAISLSLGENGIFIKAGDAKETTLKQAATEKINLKITSMQIHTYGNEQRMPTLQEFADGLCEDNEIEYVELQSKKVASLEKINVGDATSIFTKLKQYPYEFEINSSLQLASIDGIKVATSNTETYTPCNPILLTGISLPGSSSRDIGTYYANDTSFNKTNTAEFEKYFAFDKTKGWTVLKSGNYMINAIGYVGYGSAEGRSPNSIYIGDTSILLNTGWVRSTCTYISPVTNTTFYIEKGTVINFSSSVLGGKLGTHGATFYVYALFK